jgi:hypothetical protein
VPQIADDSQAYRRGVVLGLTLAELLLLLLFLFLLIMASILYQREEIRLEIEERFNVADEERRAFRNSLNVYLEEVLGTQSVADPGRPLSAQELEEPLARLSRLSSEYAATSAQLRAARSELEQLRQGIPPTEREASALRQENARIQAELAQLNAALGDAQALIDQARQISPDEAASDVLRSALSAFAGLDQEERALPTQLAACEAERSNLGRQLNYTQQQCGREGDFPPCVYRDNGQIAFLYDVFLTQRGIVVSRGDEGSFRSLTWVAALPDPVYGEPMSVAAFQSATRPHLATSQRQNPQCRFFVRIHDRMGEASRQEFLDQYLGVQSHFYHLLTRN